MSYSFLPRDTRSTACWPNRTISPSERRSDSLNVSPTSSLFSDVRSGGRLAVDFWLRRHSGTASCAIPAWRSRRPPSETRSTCLPRSSSKSSINPAWSNSEAPGSNVTSRSTSLSGRFSPRAIEPKNADVRRPVQAGDPEHFVAVSAKRYGRTVPRSGDESIEHADRNGAGAVLVSRDVGLAHAGTIGELHLGEAASRAALIVSAAFIAIIYHGRYYGAGSPPDQDSIKVRRR